MEGSPLGTFFGIPPCPTVRRSRRVTGEREKARGRVSTSRNQRKTTTTPSNAGRDELLDPDPKRSNSFINRCSTKKKTSNNRPHIGIFSRTHPWTCEQANTARTVSASGNRPASRSVVYAKAKYGRYRYVTRPAGFFACESLEKTDETTPSRLHSPGSGLR